GADFYWRQDAAAGTVSRAYMGRAGSDCRCVGNCGGGLASVSAEGKRRGSLVRKSPRLKRHQQGKLLLRRQAGGVPAARCPLFLLRKHSGTVHILIGEV